jgi:hypothetical protein
MNTGKLKNQSLLKTIVAAWDKIVDSNSISQRRVVLVNVQALVGIPFAF